MESLVRQNSHNGTSSLFASIETNVIPHPPHKKDGAELGTDSQTVATLVSQ